MSGVNMPGKIIKQIRKWTCHKLECFSDYIEAYAKALKDKEYCYLDLYAGCGSCLCKGTDCYIDDSELRALKIKTKFAKYIFVVRNRQSAENLKQLTTPYSADNNIEIITGNCNNEKVIRRLLDLIPRSSSSFALIDPAGYRRLHWTTIEQLATHGTNWQGDKMDLLIIFPLEMALLRNLMRPECHPSITRFYGNHQWEEIRRQKLSGAIRLDEARSQLVELFKSGLSSLGYHYVEDFKPASPYYQPFYHLILASDNTGAENLKNAWGKQRYLRCELLYKVKEPVKR